jgi:hypothetical protein
VNVQQQIAKLESLLGRIQRNAAKPRAAVRAAAPAPARPIAEEMPQSALPATTRGDIATPIPSARAPLPVEPELIAASAPEASVEVEELDMMDEEIVELGGEATATVVGGDTGTEADFDGMDDEPVPESAPRPAAQALAEPADLEPPVKTPPPESGRQFVSPAVAAPVADFGAEEVDIAGAEVDDLLEPDRSGPSISGTPPGELSMEQLGETVELEGADAPRAELDLIPLPDEPLDEVGPPDELELSLPQQGFAGGFDQKLAAPPGARADLDRHLRDQGLPEPRAAAPAVGSAAPVVVARPASDVTHVAQIIAARPASMPSTFLELLDASLALTARR